MVNSMKVVNDNEWTFVAVHKSRVTLLKNAYLVNGTNPKVKDKSYTTIIPLVFKRKKEHENHIFFSLPNTFEVTIRITDLGNETYSEKVLSDEEKNKFFKFLNNSL